MFGCSGSLNKPFLLAHVTHRRKKKEATTTLHVNHVIFPSPCRACHVKFSNVQIFRHRWFDLETSRGTHVRGGKEMPLNCDARAE